MYKTHFFTETLKIANVKEYIYPYICTNGIWSNLLNVSKFSKFYNSFYACNSDKIAVENPRNVRYINIVASQA